jgi:hypothetical protein
LLGAGRQNDNCSDQSHAEAELEHSEPIGCDLGVEHPQPRVHIHTKRLDLLSKFAILLAEVIAKFPSCREELIHVIVSHRPYDATVDKKLQDAY